MKSIADAIKEMAMRIPIVADDNIGIGINIPSARFNIIAKEEHVGRIFKYSNTTIHTFGDVDSAHDFGECHPKCPHLSWEQTENAKYGHCSLFQPTPEETRFHSGSGRLGKCRCRWGSGAIRCKECYRATEKLRG